MAVISLLSIIDNFVLTNKKVSDKLKMYYR